MEMPQHKWGAYAALGFGVLCIGLSAIFVKLAGVSGPASAFYRLGIAGLVLVPVWLKRRPATLSFATIRLTLLGGLFFALDLAVWNIAILRTSAATATLLANNAPLWVGLGSLLLFHERLSMYYWMGLTCSLVGMILVIGVHAVQHLTFNTGDLLAIAASFLYASYLLVTHRVRATMDTLTFMTISVSTGTVVLLAICLLFGVPLYGYSPTAWLALIGVGLISQLSGWLAINYALGHIRATRVSVTLLGQVIVTTVLAVFLFGEKLSLEQMIGGGLVLGGICLVYQGKTPKKS